jgi:peptidoglycan hydrolase-like protein with peptidoglycan-binding domain
MSETTSRGHQDTSQREDRDDTGAAAQPHRARRRWVAATVVALVVLGAGAAAAWSAGASRSTGASGGNTGAAPPQTYTVTRKDISATTSENATLGYAASYAVTGQGGGTLTWLPPAGRVIRQGQVLYRVDNGTPVVLLYGSVPAWRSLSEGTTGEDVTQLNHDLADLGYASSSDIHALGWDYYSWETRYAVEDMEEDLGVSSPSGSLSLGSVVFKPEALRVSQVTASLGSPASGPILSATSDWHVVTIALSTSMESEVKAGDSVSVTLPDGSATPGVITSVGAVASGSASSPTIPVSVKLTNPSAAGSLDQAPVTVYITTARVSNVLVVDVGALLAQPAKGDGEVGGGYAVEVVAAGNTRRLVPVKVGLFDDSAGLVQVTGNLRPGERVVVPNI